jgi:hypothetical protein
MLASTQALGNAKTSHLSVTLKALANVSPGFALKPWVHECPRKLLATLTGLCHLWFINADATPSELRLRERIFIFPGLPKRNPGLELANAVSVGHRAFDAESCRSSTPTNH